MGSRFSQGRRNRAFHLFDELGHGFPRAAGHGDGLMKGDLDGPFPDQPLPVRHQLERSPDRHGYDGRPALDGQEEAASPERLKIPVPASHPLGIDEERVSFFPDQPRRPVEDRHQKGAVQEAQVVGHENVGGRGVKPLESRDLDVDAEDAPADTYHPVPVSEKRLPEPEEDANEKYRDGENQQEDINEDEEGVPYGAARL